MEIDIVLNQCHGGFGLSPFAMKVLAENNSSIIKRTIIPESLFNDYKRFAKSYDGYWAPFSSYIMRREGGHYVAYELNDDDQFYFRTHPDLVGLLRKYGSQKVSGECAKLAIVTKYIDLGIESYDGYENIN